MRYCSILVVGFIILLFSQCAAQDKTHLIEMGKLPKSVKESSGLAAATETSLWTHNDSGGKAEIFEVSLRGKMIRKVTLEGVIAVDMEDMTQDNDGNLFIADTGNNKRERLKLRVFKINVKEIENNSVTPEVIEFVLPEKGLQSKCHYDFEAITWSKGKLYLFTKDRCDKKDNKLILYSIPDDKGTYTAENIGDFFWENASKNIKITSADISFDGKRLVLLSKNAIHFFLGYRKDEFFNGAYRYLPIKKSMKEALVHMNDCDLFISEEARKDHDARLWKINLCAIDFD